MTKWHMPPEMCGLCGFVMAAVVGFDRAPADHDISCCAGCGFPYVLHDAAWRPITVDELTALPVDDLARLLVLRRMVQIRAARRPAEPPRLVS